MTKRKARVTGRKPRSGKRGTIRQPPKPRQARGKTKTATCLGLLGRPEGATIAELQKTTGWQTHSVRGFLAAAVRKKLGLDLVSAKEERGRVYRLRGGVSKNLS